MCFRDEIPTSRSCVTCGGQYYGSLGHIGCPGAPVRAPEAPKPAPFVCTSCSKSKNWDRHRCKSPAGGLNEKQRKQRRVTEKLPVCSCMCEPF